MMQTFETYFLPLVPWCLGGSSFLLGLAIQERRRVLRRLTASPLSTLNSQLSTSFPPLRRHLIRNLFLS